MRSISAAESMVCRGLRAVLERLPSEAAIEDSDDFRAALFALERFLPEVVGEVYPYCPALDGVYSSRVLKHSESEIEIVGLCCLLETMGLTPLHVRLQLSPCGDRVSWLECWLGEKVDGEIRSVPYTSSIVRGNQLHVWKRLDSIDWFYEVGYGERRG